jgi:hypothetical protein
VGSASRDTWKDGADLVARAVAFGTTHDGLFELGQLLAGETEPPRNQKTAELERNEPERDRGAISSSPWTGFSARGRRRSGGQG